MAGIDRIGDVHTPGCHNVHLRTADGLASSALHVLTTLVTWTCAARAHGRSPVCARRAMFNDARGVVACSSGGDRRGSDARRSMRQMRRTRACAKHGVRSHCSGIRSVGIITIVGTGICTTIGRNAGGLCRTSWWSLTAGRHRWTTHRWPNSATRGEGVRAAAGEPPNARGCTWKRGGAAGDDRSEGERQRWG